MDSYEFYLQERRDKRENVKYIVVAIVLIIILLAVRSELKASSEKRANDKIFEDPNYKLASDLVNAINYSVVSEVLHTANDDELFRIAELVTDYKSVEKAYFELTGEQLVTRMQKVFVDDRNKFNTFYTIFRKDADPKNPNPSSLPKRGVLVVGKKCTALTTCNAFNSKDSRTVEKVFKAGEEVGIYKQEFVSNVKGVNTFYALVEIPYFGLWTQNVLILKNALIQY